ncbi:E3 ubiquitin-protein ligase AIRP2-like isoform X1 [Typha angustifolia]|uniref:E3 ubiquitin-protein ligase AIRP2-like n=1 Tax=Typha latifolia TaxID=4733 RepID=UPI003C2C7792
MFQSQLGRPLSFRGSLKALEADIHHANTLADGIQRAYGGACVQMRLSYSPLAPILLYLIQWMDCSCSCTLPSYLGLLHILVYKVYSDGDSSISTYERRASLREFYAIIYPSLRQLESNLMVKESKEKSRGKDGSRKRMDDWRKLSDKDLEREDECGICMEICTKMVLPNCNHAMCINCYRDWYIRSQSCPFCRGSLKRVRSRDLWVLTSDGDVIDTATLEKENVRHFHRFIDSLPLIIPDNLFLFYYDYLV